MSRVDATPHSSCTFPPRPCPPAGKSRPGWARGKGAQEQGLAAMQNSQTLFWPHRIVHWHSVVGNLIKLTGMRRRTTCTHTCAHKLTHTHTRIQTRRHTCTGAHTHTHKRTHTHTHTHTLSLVPLHTRAHTHTQTHTHTHTHTLTSNSTSAAHKASTR